MRITRFSDIGLRVLIYLAGADQQRSPATVGEIAKQFDVPVNHLVKVVGQLARVGWIQALRGRHGGLRLNADAAALRIGAVLRELEGDAELVDCEGQQCCLSQNCILRGALAAGLRAFYDAMDRYTLADLIGGSVGEQIIVMHRNFLRPQEQNSKSS
ncbi:RrF2 family transcriptional regulator [Noviherbaspirillum saxi]|uniref:Rrf2 family transcriptional regulator n=1 Tax=Noviherbaspirillum saxi TaxID=2320863 RepID=A0A3A3FL17_9BURK|nr:Rrf2 family transcriptional regulator [Noviherbaspirillum saxi]RJF96183.1 Rrf2 family transcriptional regulator [Noviherbaspirillum saxi]